ncbi:MAG TPA: hypothetical protein VGD76_05135 [Ramlibacter sp.]
MNPGQGSAFAGAAIAALGAALGVAMVLHPQAMRVPAPVAYLCALAFLFAGLTLIARARGHRLLQAWLPVLMVGSLVAPAVWLGFGSGRRQCTLSAAESVVRIFATRPDLACRLGFAVAAVAGLGILLLAVRHAVRSSRRPDAG